jgi:type II secretory pathway pseudopilin PulG
VKRILRPTLRPPRGTNASSPAKHDSKRTRRARILGFSAIEVLMAITVMAVGASAIMSMQKASVLGNFDARETDIANSIARTWVERLQRDSLQWTLPSSADPTGNNFANAKLLATHVTGSWFLPTDYTGATPEMMSPGFDILGRDVAPANLATAKFCANVRLTWLVTQALPAEPGLIRADVRVIWPRGLYSSPAGGFCVSSVATTLNPDPIVLGQQPVYHAIYLTTTLRENSQ